MSEVNIGRDTAFWNDFHKHDKDKRKHLKRGGVGIVVLSAAAIIVPNLIGEDSVTEATAPDVPAPDTATSLPQLEKFSFENGSIVYECEVLTDPHQVVAGDHIWGIVDAQQLPDDPASMPDRWVGTIDINQDRATVGQDPNLIYPGNQIYLLTNCVEM